MLVVCAAEAEVQTPAVVADPSADLALFSTQHSTIIST